MGRQRLTFTVRLTRWVLPRRIRTALRGQQIRNHITLLTIAQPPARADIRARLAQVTARDVRPCRAIRDARLDIRGTPFAVYAVALL